MQKEVDKFFSFEAPSQLVFALNILNKIDNNNKYFNKIVEFNRINKDQLLFEIQDKPILENECQKSPSTIQDHIFCWPYYAIFYIQKKNNNFKKFNNSIIVNYIFQFHFLTIKELYTLQKDDSTNQLETIAQFFTRVIEILIAFSSETNVNRYFPKDRQLIFNFVEQIFYSENERKKFSVQNFKQNHFLYSENENTKKIIYTSRILTTNFQIDSFINDVQLYQKLLDQSLHLKTKKNTNKKVSSFYPANKYSKNAKVYESVPSSKVYDEAIEESSYPIISHQICEDEQIKQIPNKYKQAKINRAYSSNYTKNQLVTSYLYHIPPIGLLKQFLHFNFEHADDAPSKFYLGILLVGVLTGQDYETMIKMISGDTKNIKYKSDIIKIDLDDSFFAKNSSNDQFLKSVTQVEYKIPFLLGLLLQEMQKYIKSFVGDILSDTEIKKYYSYVKDKCDNYYYTISINPNKIHNISLAYIREQNIEDFAFMFSTGKYYQNDVARLVYASVNKNQQFYSHLIEKLFYNLSCDKYLPDFLKIPKFVDKPLEINTKELVLAGSNLVIKKEVLAQFFGRLKFDILNCDQNSIEAFNLTSVYMRVAMSLLCGTRTFTHSSNLENISYYFKILKISEKADTNITGLRVIPLCSSVIALISKYQENCKTMGIPENDVYLLDSNKAFHYFTKEMKNREILPQFICDFFQAVPLNFGRHLFTKYAIEMNLQRSYIDAFLGHYSAGLEQNGIYSTMNYQEYFESINTITTNMSEIYGVEVW